MNRTIGLTLASAILLAAGFAATRAEAFMPKVTGLDAATEIVTPAAMCGRSCRNGGRYIPGPPSVCEQEGLNYCGSSRGGGGGGGVGVVIPGTGVGIGVGPGGGGVYVAPGRNCRTITVERSDGSVRRTQRCD
jgi:hypothetical protein